MVDHPGEYKWSSYHANAQNSCDALIEGHPIYIELGLNVAVRQAAYLELFKGQIDNDTLHDISESLNHELVPCRSYFKDKIEEITNRQTRLGIPGRPMIGEEGVIYVVY